MTAMPSSSAILPVYGNAKLAFVRGEGCYLWGEDGRRYLDFGSGIAVCSLGHCHPHLITALREQAEKLWHCSNVYRIPIQERLAQRLVAASFADYAFFSNSGAEAIEATIKITRKYHDETGRPDRWRIITVNGAFHGRTLTCISAAGNPKYLKGFTPAVDGFDHVAFGNLNEMRAAITDNTAGILLEPIQGEGGIRASTMDYLKQLREICDEFGLLLIFDEIQCGMGRTGKLFAHEWAGITPDLLATAKGIGGGFPLGATLVTKKAAAGMTQGTHGTTFGGNPLAMAVGNAVLDIILAPGFLEKVDRLGRQLQAALTELVTQHKSIFSEVRGQGLILGLKCIRPNTEVIQNLQEAGLLTIGAADNVIRIIPPLIIEEAQIVEAVGILDKVAKSLSAKETQEKVA
ncbi:MAG: aspartate aminotransferase family protein [Alphaproteobacteria bacterium]